MLNSPIFSPEHARRMHISVRHEFARMFMINLELTITQTRTYSFDVCTECVRKATLRPSKDRLTRASILTQQPPKPHLTHPYFLNPLRGFYKRQPSNSSTLPNSRGHLFANTTRACRNRGIRVVRTLCA